MAVTHEEYTEQGIIVLTPTDELLTAKVIQETYASIDTTAAKQARIQLLDGD